MKNNRTSWKCIVLLKLIKDFGSYEPIPNTTTVPLVCITGPSIWNSTTLFLGSHTHWTEMSWPLRDACLHCFPLSAGSIGSISCWEGVQWHKVARNTKTRIAFQCFGQNQEDFFFLFFFFCEPLRWWAKSCWGSVSILCRALVFSASEGPAGPGVTRALSSCMQNNRTLSISASVFQPNYGSIT